MAYQKKRQQASALTEVLVKILSSKVFLWLLLVWFIVQTTYYAITVRFGFPPDETYHFNFIQLFAQHFPSPILHSQGSYSSLAESVHNPFFLYHYILSFPYKLIGTWSNSYIILRLLNICLALGSIYVLCLISKVLKFSALTRNLSILMLTNTMMFTFLSASISYDNMLILMSVSSIYLLILLIQKITAARILIYLSVLLGGLMTTVNFLPIGLVLFMLFIYILFKNRSELPRVFYISFKLNRIRNYILLLVLLFLSALFVQRYILNLARYHTYSPGCTAVRSLNDCEKNAIYKRDTYARGVGRKSALLSPIRYARGWESTMKRTLFGLFAGSKKNIPPSRTMGVFVDILAVAMLVGLAFVVRWKDKLLISLLFISIFYLFVLFVYNYVAYKGTGRVGIAIQGRYSLPVLPFIYLLGNHSIEKILNRKILVAFYAMICIVFFGLSGLPHYLRHSDPSWHRTYAVSKPRPVSAISSFPQIASLKR